MSGRNGQSVSGWPAIGADVLVTVFGSVSLPGRVERVDNGWFWVRVTTGSLVVCGRTSLVPVAASASASPRASTG